MSCSYIQNIGAVHCKPYFLKNELKCTHTHTHTYLLSKTAKGFALKHLIYNILKKTLKEQDQEKNVIKR
jgi:hypothetical protein